MTILGLQHCPFTLLLPAVKGILAAVVVSFRGRWVDGWQGPSNYGDRCLGPFSYVHCGNQDEGRKLQTNWLVEPAGTVRSW